MSHHRNQPGLYPIFLGLFVIMFSFALAIAGCMVQESAQQDSQSQSKSHAADLPFQFHPSDIATQFDAQNAVPVSDDPNAQSAPDENENPGTRVSPVPNKNIFISKEHGYWFDYPTTWTLKEETDQKIIFTGEKPMTRQENSQHDRFQVEVIYLEPNGNENFNTWFAKFPKGTEKFTLNSNDYFFVAMDSEGPFIREYYKPLAEKAALKFELRFTPGFFPELEGPTSSYTTFSRAYAKQVMKEFVNLVASMKLANGPK